MTTARVRGGGRRGKGRRWGAAEPGERPRTRSRGGTEGTGRGPPRSTDLVLLQLLHQHLQQTRRAVRGTGAGSRSTPRPPPATPGGGGAGTRGPLPRPPPPVGPALTWAALRHGPADRYRAMRKYSSAGRRRLRSRARAQREGAGVGARAGGDAGTARAAHLTRLDKGHRASGGGGLRHGLARGEERERASEACRPRRGLTGPASLYLRRAAAAAMPCAPPEPTPPRK